MNVTIKKDWVTKVVLLDDTLYFTDVQYLLFTLLFHLLAYNPYFTHFLLPASQDLIAGIWRSKIWTYISDLHKVKYVARCFFLSEKTDTDISVWMLYQEILRIILSYTIPRLFGIDTLRLKRLRKNWARKEVHWINQPAIRNNQRMKFVRALHCTSNDLPKSTFWVA